MASAIIVNMTLNFPETILVETSLSFLGLGIQRPLTGLGNMVGFGRDYLLTAWWIVLCHLSLPWQTGSGPVPSLAEGCLMPRER